MSDRFSYSKIETYSNCPRQYKFRYIQRAKVEKEVTVELFLGQALHKCLQRLYEARSVSKVLTLDELLKIYRAEWEKASVETLKVSSDQLSVSDYIQNGRETLEKYYATYAPFSQEETLSVEARVQFTLDQERGFKMSGIIDRMARRPDGSTEIIDYKYKKGLPRQADVERDRQLALYVMAARENWPDFNTTRARLIFLKQNVEFQVDFDTETLEEIRYDLTQRILEIKRAEKEDDFPPDESPLCNWCPYYSLCPAKRHSISLGDKQVPPDEDEISASELADRFLTLKRKQDAGKSELDALREELVETARRLELTALEGKQGTVKITDRTQSAFPTKTDSREDFMNISALAKAHGLELFESYAELKPAELYKAFIREELPAELREKLQGYLIEKKIVRINTIYREPARPDSGD
ncbi:MAG: PD-(D/E)XK nuclease family protein [candidate division Zixibacteria bacterium]|nr:PD-(D/E)XK nuclease family protein [candidate division Zixibacteria bacterium]